MISKQRQARKRFLCLFLLLVLPTVWSPLASLITFLSTLLLHAEARVIHETEACVTFSMKGRSSLVAGEDFQGMFLTVGIGILLGFAIGVLCCLAGRKW